jgi:hypothetical protein
MSRLRSHFNPGRWIVERERFHLDAGAKPPSTDVVERVADIIPSMMKKMGLEERFWEQSLVSSWPSIVGEAVARHTRPGRVQRKTLYIFVRNAAWLGELSRYGQREILANIQAKFGADRITSLRLQQDPDMAQP